MACVVVSDVVVRAKREGAPSASIRAVEGKKWRSKAENSLGGQSWKTCRARKQIRTAHPKLERKEQRRRRARNPNFMFGIIGHGTARILIHHEKRGSHRLTGCTSRHRPLCSRGSVAEKTRRILAGIVLMNRCAERGHQQQAQTDQSAKTHCAMTRNQCRQHYSNYTSAEASKSGMPTKLFGPATKKTADSSHRVRTPLQDAVEN